MHRLTRPLFVVFPRRLPTSVLSPDLTVAVEHAGALIAADDNGRAKNLYACAELTGSRSSSYFLEAGTLMDLKYNDISRPPPYVFRCV